MALVHLPHRGRRRDRIPARLRAWTGGHRLEAQGLALSLGPLARTRKAIELAKAGDLAALRVCLDRIAPPRKDRPVLFELPPVLCAADAAKAAAALLEAVAIGDLTPSEASELGKLIEAYVKAIGGDGLCGTADQAGADDQSMKAEEAETCLQKRYVEIE